MNKMQKNVVTVLERLIDHVKLYEDDADQLAEGIDFMLDQFHMDDFFGTEGQMDPRGDFRSGTFSMRNVQGA